MIQDNHEAQIHEMILELAAAGALPPFPVPASEIAKGVTGTLIQTFIADRLFAPAAPSSGSSIIYLADAPAPDGVQSEAA